MLCGTFRSIQYLADDMRVYESRFVCIDVEVIVIHVEHEGFCTKMLQNSTGLIPFWKMLRLKEENLSSIANNFIVSYVYI